MELYKFHVGKDRAGFVGDGHAVACCNFRVGGLAIDLSEAAGGEESRGGVDFVEGAIGFVNETGPDGFSVFEKEAGREGVRPQMKMWNGIGAGEKSAADFAASGVTMGVENAGAAVGGFAGESELCAGAVKFGAPFDELRDVPGPFLDKEGYGFRAAEAIARVDRVLLVEADFVFVEDTAGLAEFDGRAQACDTRADDGVVCATGFSGMCHRKWALTG
jgi:hypothetical protein